MAEILNPNIKTFYEGATGDRGSPVGTADWVGGANKGGSNAPGIGINTGDYDPKTGDWSRHVRNPQNSQTIGHTAAAINIERPAGTFTEVTAFVQAAASTAPDANLIAGPPAVVNRTGKTVPANSWAWGSRAAS